MRVHLSVTRDEERQHKMHIKSTNFYLLFVENEIGGVESLNRRMNIIKNKFTPFRITPESKYNEENMLWFLNNVPSDGICRGWYYWARDARRRKTISKYKHHRIIPCCLFNNKRTKRRSGKGSSIRGDRCACDLFKKDLLDKRERIIRQSRSANLSPLKWFLTLFSRKKNFAEVDQMNQTKYWSWMNNFELWRVERLVSLDFKTSRGSTTHSGFNLLFFYPSPSLHPFAAHLTSCWC